MEIKLVMAEVKSYFTAVHLGWSYMRHRGTIPMRDSISSLSPDSSLWACNVDCCIYQASLKQSEMPSANCKHRDIIRVPSGRQTEAHFLPIMSVMLYSEQPGVIMAWMRLTMKVLKGQNKVNPNTVRTLTLIYLVHLTKAPYTKEPLQACRKYNIWRLIKTM